MSQDSIRRVAEEVKRLTDRLDVLINNAGMMTLEKKMTEEGIESQFGCNHVGHFLFTNLLVPLLLPASGKSRVVNLTSLGHRLSPVRFHDYNFEGKEIPEEEKPRKDLPEMFQVKEGKTYNGWLAYGQAKSANILFSVGLNERLKNKRIVGYAVHPGCELIVQR